jgi:YVTN family beta-propeller protein
MAAGIGRRRFLAALAAPVGACRRRKAEGFAGYAFVANREGGAVAVVDLGAFAVVRHIRLDSGPSAVVADRKRQAVYALAPESGAIYEIGADDLALRRRLRCSESALTMKLAPGGDRLWVLCGQPPRLVGLSLGVGQFGAAIELPARPADFDLAPEAPLAAISLGEAGVALADLEGGRPARLVRPGKSFGPILFRRDGRLVLAGNPGERLLTILEPPEGRTVVHLPLAVAPRHFGVKADGGQLFITGEGMDAVVTVYPYRTEVGSTTLAGHAPGFVAASTDPDYLFVANPASGDVTVLDIETQRVVAVVAVGREPAFITVTPDNEYALVLNRGSGDMAVIRIAALSGRRRKFAPLFTMIPVGSAPVSAVVMPV